MKYSLYEWCFENDRYYLVEEWHPKKNGMLIPKKVSARSGKKVWWQCKEGHEWEGRISHRTNKEKPGKCPICSGRKILIGYNDLLTVNPILANEWHFKKNNNLKPTDVTIHSGKKVWWRCLIGHEWEAKICNRTNGNGCPYCDGRRVITGENDLETVNPILARQWHPTKNDNCIPNMLMPNSNKKVWWLGPCNHEWQATVASRNKGSNCPYCSNKYIIQNFNDLATTNPSLAKEWHPIKNGTLKPTEVSEGSEKKVWWLGECGHEWQAIIQSRKRSKKCPYCCSNKVLKGYNDLFTINPKLGEEWHPTKNKDIGPTNVMPNSNKKVWWLGDCGHEWQAVISSRNLGSNCPFCNEGNQTSFPEQAIFFYIKQVYPDARNRYFFNDKYELDIYIPSINLGIEYDGYYYHNTKKSFEREKEKDNYFIDNGVNFYRIKETNEKIEKPYVRNNIVYFTYDKGKRLSSAITTLFTVAGISYNKIDVSKDEIEIYNSYNQMIVENSLLLTNPNIAEEWHHLKNGKLMPNNFLPKSNKNVWWLCSEGHEWRTTIATRTAGSNCPTCAKQNRGAKKVANLVKQKGSLADNNLNLTKEWHPSKNGNLTASDVTDGSNKKVWWLCSKGHEWQTKVEKRTAGSNCPTCAKQNQGAKKVANLVKQKGSLVDNNPNIAKEWHPSKNGNLTASDVTVGSSKKVWWLCSEGHEWQTTVKHRKRGTGCPTCAKQNQGAKRVANLVKQKGSLADNNPNLTKEWHPSKNGNLTASDVTDGSNKKVWWLCSKGHEWQTRVDKRTAGSKCPTCAKQN